MSQPLAQPRLVVIKGERQLRLYAGRRLVRAYPVVVGRDPQGHKRREGDCRTPEGEYYVCVKNPRSRFHLSLGLSYPNAQDAARGLREGVITREQHDRIVEAIRRGEVPDWYTPLGGEICIHGGGAGRPGTRGCVGMEDAHVEELYALVPLGTPVIIRP
ncbi:MAG: L,D-transpeptidase family protein [bacterium]